MQSLSVKKIDKDKNLVSWTVSGDGSVIDHFILFLEKEGIKNVIGTCHNEFHGKFRNWVHSVKSSDRGPSKYSVLPVFNDYSLGEEISTKVVHV